MIEKRFILWIMLFSGIMVHMICNTNLNIAITAMVKIEPKDSNHSFIPYCRVNNNDSTEEMSAMISDGEYNWSSEEKSVLMGSYSWFIGVSHLLGALMCQKLGGKVMLGLSNLLVGILSCMIPVAAEFGVGAVIAMRAFQGFIGGGGSGVATKSLISKWVPPNERSKFMSVVAGVHFGAFISYFLNGWILHFFGWRYVFYVSGAISATWCVLWYFIVYETPQQDPNISTTELMYIKKAIGNSLSIKKLPVPWWAILTSGPVIVSTIVYIGADWTSTTLLLYVPTYLQEIHGFPSYMIGEFSSLPYLLEVVFIIGFAIYMDTLLRKNILSVTNIRKVATFFSTTMPGIAIGCLIFGGCNVTIIISLLTVATVLHGALIAGVAANIVDMSPNFCVIIYGLQGLISKTTGFISPMVVGYLTGKHRTTDAWNKVFILTCVIKILSGLLFFIFGDSSIQKWNFEKGPTDETGGLESLKSQSHERSLCDSEIQNSDSDSGCTSKAER